MKFLEGGGEGRERKRENVCQQPYEIEENWR